MTGPDRRRGRRVAPALAALALLLAVAIAGCGSSASTTASTTSSNEQREPPASASAAARIIQRSPATGREPGEPKGAAGACGRAHGEIPTLTIEPDVPSPRCLVVSPRQRLRVLNETGAEGAQGAKITIDFAGFHAAIPLGESVILEDRLGTYLMPGSHYLQVHGGPGPAEVRLQG